MTTQTEDIVKDNITRELPCSLNDLEVLKIARAKAKTEAELEELQDEIKDERSAQAARLEAVEKRIEIMGGEIRTGEQRRPVPCYERFVNGTIEVVRKDTSEVIDRRAASLVEAQKVMPMTDAPAADASTLDQAAHMQRGFSEDDDEAPDEGEPESEPKKKRRGKAK